MLEERSALMEQVIRLQSNQLDPAAFGSGLAKNLADGISKGMMMSREKRSRSPEGGPEEPKKIMVECSEEDDNHTVFAWTARRMYRNPNADPASYWPEAKYELDVKPNVKGNLVLGHLMPLSVNGKALGWAHSARQQLEIKYFTHSNRTTKRSKKEGLTISSGTDGLGTSNFSIEEHWDPAGTLKDLLDGLYNLQAALFQIRPWDWTVLVISRVIHETGAFSGCSNSKEQQVDITEQFINEALFQSRNKLGLGKPPNTYKETLAIGEAIVGNTNGRGSELLRGKNQFTARWDLKEKDQTINNLNSNVRDLRNENTGLRQQIQRLTQLGGAGVAGTQNNNYQGGIGRGRGRGKKPKATTPQSPGMPPAYASYIMGSDPAFEEARKPLCLNWNLRRCAKGNCGRTHVCNVRTGPGQPCSQQHTAWDHR